MSLTYKQRQECVAQALEAAQGKLDQIAPPGTTYEEYPFSLGKTAARTHRILSAAPNADDTSKNIYITFYGKPGTAEWQIMARGYPPSKKYTDQKLCISISGSWKEYDRAIDPERTLEALVLRPLLKTFKTTFEQAASEIEEEK